MSTVHYSIANDRLATAKVFVTPSALERVFQQTKAMRTLAKESAEMLEIQSKTEIQGALDVLDKVATSRPVAIVPSNLEQRLIKQSLAENLEQMKIAEENHCAAYSTPVNLALISMNLLRKQGLQGLHK